MHASELYQLSEEFDKIPTVQSLTLVGSSLVVEKLIGVDDVNSLTDSQEKRFSQLMTNFSAPRLRRSELGKIVQIGSQYRFGKAYEIFFVEYDNSEYLAPPDCAEDSVTGFGACSYPLNGNWALRYEWVPIAVSER